MFQIIKQISVIFSAVILIIASGGFNFYQRYCNCTDEISHSIVIESPPCYEEEKPITCSSDNADNATSCCETEPDKKNKNRDCESTDNCCTVEFTFLKTDIYDYTIDQKKSFNFTSSYVLTPESIEDQKKYTFIEKYTFAFDLPPPDYGKELLISLHQIKIATPLV